MDSMQCRAVSRIVPLSREALRSFRDPVVSGVSGVR